MLSRESRKGGILRFSSGQRKGGLSVKRSGRWDRVLNLAPLFTWGGNLVAIAILIYVMAKGIRLPGAAFFWSLMVALLGSSLEEVRKRRRADDEVGGAEDSRALQEPSRSPR